MRNSYTKKHPTQPNKHGSFGSIMANKLRATNLERFIRRINLRLRVNSANYIAL